MLKKEIVKFSLGSSPLDTELPKQCPICSGFGAPTVTNKQNIQKRGISEFMAILEFYCHACDTCFYGIYDFLLPTDRSALFGKLVITIPNALNTPLPDFVQTVSPRAAKLYEGAENALSQGYEDLSGTGFRNAMEILMLDYGLKVIGIEESKLLNKQKGRKLKDLFHLIKEVLPTVQLQNSADVVRILGNDYTHYYVEYSDKDIKILKRYLDIMITMLEGDYMSRYPEYKRKE